MSRTPARRVIQSILAGEWAILPAWLEEMVALAERVQAEGSSLTPDGIREAIRSSLADLREGGKPPSALAFRFGKSIGAETRATHRDGVAIVPILGPLFHYADSLHDVCGCSSYTQIAADIAAVREAREGGLVHSVLFEVDTPGGEAGGCGECAGMIADLAAEMPAASYASDFACSAGYWLASAAGRVIGSPSSKFGSIGVAASFRRRDTKGTIEIVSSQSPRKRPDLETDAGKDQIRAVLDALAEVFISDVATYRGVTPETVIADFGQGDILVGRHAVEAGLIDELGTFEATLDALARQDSGDPLRSSVRPAARGESPAPTSATSPEEIHMPETTTDAPAAGDTQPKLTLESLTAAHPELVQQIRAAAATEAAEAERARLLTIADLPGKPQTKRACQEDGTCSPGDAAQKLLAEQQAAAAARGQAELDARAGDESKLDAPGPSADADASDDDVAVQRLLAAAKQTGVGVKSHPRPEAN